MASFHSSLLSYHPHWPPMVGRTLKWRHFRSALIDGESSPQTKVWKTSNCMFDTAGNDRCQNQCVTVSSSYSVGWLSARWLASQLKCLTTSSSPCRLQWWLHCLSLATRWSFCSYTSLWCWWLTCITSFLWWRNLANIFTFTFSRWQRESQPRNCSLKTGAFLTINIIIYYIFMNWYWCRKLIITCDIMHAVTITYFFMILACNVISVDIVILQH